MFEKQNIQETISKLNSDTVKGLTEGEAFRRLRQNGRNEMRAARKKTKIQLFLEQLKDPLIYILLIAAVVSILLGEVSDALIIGTVVLVNALVGMLQEGKARKALEALRKLTTPRTIVIRDGIRREIPAAELVTGDLVELEAGGTGSCGYQTDQKCEPPGGRIRAHRRICPGGERCPVPGRLQARDPVNRTGQYGLYVHSGDERSWGRAGGGHRHGYGDRQDRFHDRGYGR